LCPPSAYGKHELKYAKHNLSYEFSQKKGLEHILSYANLRADFMKKINNENLISNITKDYPFIDKSVIGTSRLGVPIYAFIIGHGAKDIMINASHHANEWITTLLLFNFLEEKASKYNKEIDLWNEIKLHCIPLVNPDGVNMVLGKKVSNDWKANACGVDLNKNYPANWYQAKSYYFQQGFCKPGAKNFVGERPLSEPETSAMAAYTFLNDFLTTLSLHTQGEEIYYKYLDFNPKGANELAKKFAEVSGYKLEEVPEESSFAGYRDWFITEFNRPGFTIECGLGENPLPLSDFSYMYKKTSPILEEALKWTAKQA